jgi:hypothetical protein
MQHIRHLVACLSVSLIALCSHAFGLSGDPDAPSLSFPANAESQQSVMKAIVCWLEPEFARRPGQCHRCMVLP